MPRNHLLKAALQAAYKDDISQVQTLLEAISQPFAYRPEWQHLALPPRPAGRGVPVALPPPPVRLPPEAAVPPAPRS